MLTHEEMIGIQAEKHDLIRTTTFRSLEEYVLQLVHTCAYVTASRVAKNKKVLDLGCNTGYGTRILFDSAKQIVGVDVSENAVSSAKNEYGHLGITFKQIDGKRLPFDDDTFDVIVSFQVIEHIVDHSKYIGEIQRVLAPNGVVLFTTPNVLLRLDPGMKPWNEFHVREFSFSELKALLDAYFPKVGICGLFANEPLYSIEVNRLSRARESARRTPNDGAFFVHSSFRSHVKRMLPDQVQNEVINVRTKLKNFRRLLTREDYKIREFVNKYGVENFLYREFDLNAALDLLAICCSSKECLEDCKTRLTTKEHSPEMVLAGKSIVYGVD